MTHVPLDNFIVKPEHPQVVLKRYGMGAKKSWGQNFLVSEKALRKISEECCIDGGDTVLEIGAGLGTLTVALLNRHLQVVAVENDPDMWNVLEHELGNVDTFELIRHDAKTFNYEQFFSAHNGVVAGNLPYQITGAILERVIAAAHLFHKAVFMVQKEVAERICAGPGTKTRGALSVVLDAKFERRTVHTLSPGAFFPPPKVRSAVVTLMPRKQFLYGDLDEEFFNSLVRASFKAKRKTIRNSIVAASQFCAVHALEAAAFDANISLTSRAEQLETAAFVKLATALQRHMTEQAT